MIPLALVLLVATPPDGGSGLHRLPVALQVSEESLTFVVGATRLSALPVQRDARGRLEVRQLRDRLRELAAQQPDVHALTVVRGAKLSAEDVTRVTEACVAAGFRDVEVRDAGSWQPPAQAPGPPASASPPAREMTVFGAVDAAEVRRVVEQQCSAANACLERARAQKLDGRVNVKFIVSPAGTVVSAQVALSTVEGSELGNCLTSALRACTFPRPKGGGVAVVTYPFTVARRAR